MLQATVKDSDHSRGGKSQRFCPLPGEAILGDSAHFLGEAIFHSRTGEHVTSNPSRRLKSPNGRDVTKRAIIEVNKRNSTQKQQN